MEDIEKLAEEAYKKFYKLNEETDACFGDCDSTDVKVCDHTGHGCGLWEIHARKCVEILEEFLGYKAAQSTPVMKTKKVKCNCPCHKNPNMKHIVACCENGYIEVPDFYPEKKEAAQSTQSNVLSGHIELPQGILTNRVEVAAQSTEAQLQKEIERLSNIIADYDTKEIPKKVAAQSTPVPGKDLRSIAFDAFKYAVNAYRMYPDNKHTFNDYWESMGKTYAASLEAAQSTEAAEDKPFGENLGRILYGKPQEAEAGGEDEDILWKEVANYVYKNSGRHILRSENIDQLKKQFIIKRRLHRRTNLEI